MCQFFSLVTDPQAQKIMFCNWEDRQGFLKGKSYIDSPDSHSSIAKLYGYKGRAEDKLNKYEYNPLIQKFTIDQINNEIDDSSEIEAYCKRLDFKTIVPILIIKPIIQPFLDVTPPELITARHLDLLKQWDSVGASVRDSVGDSVWDSVRDSVGDSVWNSVWASVRDSVRNSVWASVRDSVWDSVWNSVRDSVGDSVRAYCGSFFDIPSLCKYQSMIDLWELGLIPSFDGKRWRLHGGPTGQILWEGTIDAGRGI